MLNAEVSKEVEAKKLAEAEYTLIVKQKAQAEKLW